MKRVVITALGILSSIGNNKKEVLSSLKEVRSGITFSQELKDSGIKSHIWGNIKINFSEVIDPKISKFMNDASIYTFLAMEQAIADSGLKYKMISNIRTGLIVGSGNTSPRNQFINFNTMKKKGLRRIDPYLIIKSMSSGISACLSTFFKIKGINYSISSACATSGNCIGHAFEIIQIGKQDIIFAGGGEEISWELAFPFDSIKALSTKYNQTPKKASRTYDINRDGFVISGGAGIIVLEELEHALKRGAKIYAEIVGYGTTSDGNNIFLPSGYGAIRCMKTALKKVNSPIDYLNVHGTSTKKGDVKELWAIRKTFGKNHPEFSSTKSITGHSLGASGVHEIIFTILMLQYNFIAPSINIDKLDPEAKGMKLVRKLIFKKLNTVMSNNFGFGGTNMTLVMKKYY